MVLPMHGDPHGATALARGLQYASEDRVGTAALEVDIPLRRRVPDGRCDPGFDLWMRERSIAGGRARLLRHEPGWPLLQVSRQAAARSIKTPSAGLFVQACWTALLCVSGSYSQLLDYIIFAVLVFYILTILGLVRLARQTARREPRRTKRSATRCCRPSTSSWLHGFVSYYCDTSPNTLGRAWFLSCWESRFISSGRGGLNYEHRNNEL